MVVYYCSAALINAALHLILQYCIYYCSSALITVVLYLLL